MVPGETGLLVDPDDHVLLVGLTHPGEASCDGTRSLSRSVGGAGVFAAGGLLIVIGDVV